MPSQGNCARIDSSAFQHNIAHVKKRIGTEVGIVAMVKANCYGHYVSSLSDMFSGVDMLGVATFEEAMALRQAGTETPILLLQGFRNREQLLQCIDQAIICVVHDMFQINLLQSLDVSQSLQVWLKVDTGMCRFGFMPDQFVKAYQALVDLAIVDSNFVIMTHLSDAENSDQQHTLGQLQLFRQLTQGLSHPVSIMNSAGLMSYTDQCCDWVRPGLMLYGVSPYTDRVGADLGLRPVMSLESFVYVIKAIKAGDKVGYGCQWVCPSDRVIAIVPIGYGDGYPRHVKAGTCVLIRGRRCPIIGAISMDSMMVDISGLPTVAQGDTVVLWGRDLPVESIAQAASTIPYELLTQLGARVARIAM
tara:strand:+ start:1939 stop:3021 length:1083 start_codon:yes stop_codon:yes gene_type:complete